MIWLRHLKKQPMAISQSDLQSWIGQKLELSFDIERSQLRRLAQSVGDAAELPVVFPALFYTVHHWLENLGLNMHTAMHAEETYEYFQNIAAGDTINVEHCIVEAYRKEVSGGELLFVVIESAGFKKGEAVFKGRRVLVERRN
jgi:hypothetical protein